ncbi:MAG TPA: ferredoxin [Gaiellaceae bacterium]
MPLYRVSIDRSLCSGFGACVDASPDVFRLDGSGIALATVAETADPRVLDAADACPMGAIVVEEVAAA